MDDLFIDLTQLKKTRCKEAQPLFSEGNVLWDVVQQQAPDWIQPLLYVKL